MNVIESLTATGLISMTAGAGQAQARPSPPIDTLVPHAAGSGTDRTNRFLAPHVAATPGQQVGVEIRPGRATIIATETMHQAQSDGHTPGAPPARFVLNTPLAAATISPAPEGGTDPDFVARLNTAFQVARDDPENNASLRAQGLLTAGGSAADIAEFNASGVEFRSAVVAETGITLGPALPGTPGRAPPTPCRSILT